MKAAWIIAAVLVLASPAAAQAPVRADRIEETDGTITLVHELEIAAPVDEVWRAISTPEGWLRWAVSAAWRDPDDADILETSYDAGAQPGAPQNIRQRFLVRIPNRLLAFQTIKAPAGFVDAEQFGGVRTVFELSPVGPDRTRVRLTGAGYPSSGAGLRLLAFFDRGNATTLESLRNALEASASERD